MRRQRAAARKRNDLTPSIMDAPRSALVLACEGAQCSTAATPPGGRPRLICGNEQPVGGGANGAGTAIEHVRVDHGRADVLVSEEMLHRPNVVAVLKQVSHSAIRHQGSMLPLVRGVSRAAIRMGAAEHTRPPLGSTRSARGSE